MLLLTICISGVYTKYKMSILKQYLHNTEYSEKVIDDFVIDIE